MPKEAVVHTHPIDEVLRTDRLPHIWCPGCGLGTVMGAFARAMLASGIPLDRHAVVSGIGCTGRVPGYLKVDGFHTTHGRAIPFATGLAVANPGLTVTVFSGDGDLVAIGGNHLIHAARRNVDLNVICVNNFNYGMTGGQSGPTTPKGAITTTSPYGFPEDPFNLPRLLAALGAVFVARWTCLHVRQLEDTMIRAFQKKGFRFIEALAPCPVGFGKPNDMGEGLDEMWFYRRQGDYDPQAALEMLEVSMHKESKIICGVFVDTERPTYMDNWKKYVHSKAKQR